MIYEYLVSVGCKIEYPILVNAFRKHLYNPDPDVQGKIRTQFKDYVNRLATVSLENNMKFISLKPEFLPSHMAQKPQPSSRQEQQHPIKQPPQNPPPERHKSIPDNSISNNRLPSSHRPSIDQNVTISSPVRHKPNQAFTFSENHLSSSANYRQQTQQSYPNVVAPSGVRFNSNMIHSDNSPISQQAGNQRMMEFQHQSHPMMTREGSQIRAPNLPPPNRPQQIQMSPIRPSQFPPTSSALVGEQKFDAKSIDKENIGGSMREVNCSLPSPRAYPHTPSANQNRSLHYRSVSMQQELPKSDSRVPATVGDDSQQQPQQMPPPRPPPRRRQSSASLFKPPTGGVKVVDDGRRETQDPANSSVRVSNSFKKTLIGQVREHALKFNVKSSGSSLSLATPPANELHSKFHSQQHLSMPRRNESLREVNRRELPGPISAASGGLSAINLQRNGSYLTTRSRSSHRGEDESDSSSLQPTLDPLRRKWIMEACSCNYNGLVSLLREDPKLASYKDIVNGYTALHWAAKFGNLDIIKLISGTHGVSSNIKSSSGQTPLHVAYMFDRLDAARLLVEIYRANPNVRDHSGKKPMQYHRAGSRQSGNKIDFHSTSSFNNDTCSTMA